MGGQPLAQGLARSQGRTASVPVIVPLGDLEDTKPITSEEALAAMPIKLESLMLRYEAKAILVAIAEPDGETASAP